MKTFEIFNKNKVGELSKSLDDKNLNKILIEGLHSSAKGFLLSRVITNGIHLILLENQEEASSCVNDLYNIKGDEHIYFFPPSENKSKRNSIKDSSSKVQRTAAMGALLDYKSGRYKGDYIILVAYKESLEEEVLAEKELENSVIAISKGEKISHEFLKETLFSIHFEKVDFVSLPGEFAIRGGIIDVFSFGDNMPYRIDFFGDEVENIKVFEINTQKSKTEVEKLLIYPNISNADNNQENGVNFMSIFPAEGNIWVCDVDDFDNEQYPHREIYLSSLRKDKPYDKTFTFDTSPQPTFHKHFEVLEQDIKEKTESGYKVYILSESQSQISRLSNILSAHSLSVSYEQFTIQEGFIDHESKACFYTDHQIFDRYRRVRIKNTVERSERLYINDINSFKEGDYIVHIDHGVGRYGGLVKNNINGRIQEAIKLIYRDKDILFISIHGLHRLSKYRSGDSSAPKVYKLGAGSWQKLKYQAKEKAKEIAQDLIKLYSQRKVVKGFAFSGDSYLMDEFESSFKYEETPDQLKAAKAVKQDMEKNCPMDRLICGDVGFGKTEIAMRAAFKAVSDSKQVAVLVPTTILAFQHYNTFKERLKNFPCNIDYISRLKTGKQVKEVLEKLSSGKTDIIIGTHKLLSKDIVFKDLGLLVIDEEQKFGVVSKEKLKQIKVSVDTLILSATPIPRTLQFSLFGARDLSIINTPPPNRLPIQTEIIDFNEELIKEIIDFELDRGGQIFFVHNRVADILHIEETINRICPRARTCVGHGQMDPKLLEKKIMNYMDGDYDILIATTIIENGIDIPNTNTIIINKAQNFGLSDLHQLRGRVGRSNRKAFCYLIVPSLVALSDEAKRRLKAIEAFSDLGSGFNIAMQDLDIRGMGNIFGAEQSGYIAEMGFETYQKILAEAFNEIKEGSLTPEEVETEVYVKDCMIDTDMQILIPDSYINIPAEKIRLYRELDDISDEESLTTFISTVEDRFGAIPEEFRQLCFVVRLREEAKRKGFEKIVLKNEKMLLYFVANQTSSYYKTKQFMEIMKYIQSKPGNRYQIKEQNGKLYIVVQNVRTIEGGYSVIGKM